MTDDAMKLEILKMASAHPEWNELDFGTNLNASLRTVARLCDELALAGLMAPTAASADRTK